MCFWLCFTVMFLHCTPKISHFVWLPLFFPFYSFQTISGCWEIKHSVQQIKCKNLSGTVGEQLEYHNLQYVKYSVHLSDKQKELERLFQKVLDLMSVYVPPSRLCHLSAPHSSRPALIFIGWGRAELLQLEDSFWSFDTQMTREQTSAETANSFQRTHWRGRIKYVRIEEKTRWRIFYVQIMRLERLRENWREKKTAVKWL